MADSDDDSGSADLSLKLRRGSSDSRDSFYMEFDQGIDSDIEAVEAAARTAAAGGVAGGGQVGSGDDDLPPPPPPPPPLTEEDEMLPPPPPMEVTIPERPYPSGVHVVHEEEEEEEEEEIDVEDRGMDVVVGGVGSCIAIELPDVPELEEEDEEIEGSRTTVIMGEDQEGNVVLSLALGVPREVIEDGRDREEDSMAEVGEGEVDDSRGDYEVEGVLEVEESVDEATEDDQIVVDVVEVLKEDADWETEEEIVLPPVIVDVGNIPDSLVLDLRESVPSYSDDVLEVEADVKQEPEDFNVLVDGGDVLVPEEKFQRDSDLEQGIVSPPKDILRKESLVDEIQRVQSPFQRVQSPFQRVQSPFKDVHSPLEDNGSPVKDDRSSLKGVPSPVRDIRSPVVGDVESPLKDTQSPQKDVHSPLKDVQSPLKDLQSPLKDLQSPVKEALSPLKDIPSPPTDVPSPPKDVPSQFTDVPSPAKDVSSPTKVVTSPLNDVSTPPKVVTSPLRDVPSPLKEVRSPLKDVHSPPRDIHSPPKDVQSPLQEAKSPLKEAQSPPKYIRGLTSPLKDLQGVQSTLEEMQGMLKEMQRSQSPTVGVQSPQEKVQKIRSPVLDVERGQVPPRDVQRVQSPPKEVPKVKIPFTEMQRPIEDVQKLRSEPKDVQKVSIPPKDVQKPKSPTGEEGVKEKVREEEEVTPGPSGSAQSSQTARMPSPASSSSTTTTTSSDSASTPRRQRPGWDGSLATTDNEVAVAAAAAVALTTTGSPGAPLLLPSPASPSAILVSPETLSPSRSTPTVDLKNLQPPGHQMASAPHQQQGQQHIPNGAGLQRQAPSSLGIAPTQTGLMLYHPQMAPVAVQHHPHHVHHHPLHHHHSPGQHHVMPAAIKAAPEPPSPTVPVQAAPVPLPQPTLLHHPLQPSLPIHPSPSRSPAVPTPSIPPIAARIEPEPDNWKKLGTDALTAALSALYGKLLVVMGIAFPMAEVISTYIPPSFYEGFYLYLYIGSMGFLFYMYAMLLRDRAAYSVMSSFKRARGISVSSDSGGNQTDTEGSSTTERSGNGQHYQHQPPPRHYKKHHGHQDEQSQQSKRYRSEPGMQALAQPGGMSGSEVGTTTAAEKGKQKYRRPRRRRSHMSQRTYHYGSFYLRMGAVAFGIGSMIYSGLEFGQYFELERNTKCHNVLLALTPATRMAFIFIQMYFIFLNNEMKVYKHKLLARFGLMHMIGTNLCVWLNVLVQETKHEILTFFNPENNTLGLHSHSSRQHTLAVKFSSGVTASAASLSAVTGGATQALHNEHLPASHQVHHRVERGLKGPHHIYECRRTNIMGSLVQDASPFLFPCTIEYSLICAAILYVMWKNISRVEMTRCGSSRIGKGVDCHGVGPPGVPGGSMVSSRGKVHITPKRSPHHYSVDCARAHKGLFVGILVLVLTIISLILFFVLIGRPELVGLAVFEVNMCELTLYALSTLATLAGMIRVRELRYDGGRNLELDSILLIVSQTGMFTYSTFTVIGGHFTLERNTALVLATALASLVQTTVQTIFVLDASRRSCATASQIRRKPGREVVTFLLVANLAMWAVNTLEKSRAESHPVQLHFYGLWAWTIITHVSMPLAIFYRFHSTVCLCEIWKRAYKMKPVYM